MLTDFQNVFTVGLCSDFVMNWSLHIPPHLKGIATLPCETLMFKIWSKSTLIDISCSLSAYKLDYYILRHLKQFGYIHYDIRLSFLIYSDGRYLFSELCLPRHSVHHSLLPVQKCNNVRDLYELPDFCPLNSPDLSTFISNTGQRVYQKKTQDVDDLRQNLIDARIGVEQSVIDNGIDQWRKRLHTCIRAKEYILYIHCDIDLPKHY